MKIRQFFIASILLLVVVGGYIYFTGASELVTRSIFGREFTFVSAVWAIIPAVIMFLAALFHIMFYSSVGFFRNRALERDRKILRQLIIESLYGEESKLVLTHPQLSSLGKLLANAQLVLNGKEIKTGDEDLDKTIAQIQRVKKGEFVNFNCAIKPSKSSPVWIQNQLNRVKQDPKVSEELLRECKDNSPFCQELLESYSLIGDKKRILKGDLQITSTVALNMLSRHKNGENPLEFTSKEIVDIAKKAKFVRSDYVALAKALKNKINPDELLEIFYQFHSDPDISEAQTAWIYVNLELERIDTAREILDLSQENEYLPFKYYLALKDAGLMPKLDEIIS